MKKIKKAIYLSDLHFEHQHWMTELAYWADELKFFTNRLEEVVTRWTDKEVLAKVEQFQNQFIRHKEVIDTLKHDIKLDERRLSKDAMEHPIAIDHKHFADHIGLREQMATQRKIYGALKKEFFAFLTYAM